MSGHVIDAHVELRAQHPITWVARYTNELAGPSLVVMRLDTSLPTVEETNAAAQWYEPPTAGDGFQLVDPDHKQRVAFMTTAQLRPEIDPDRPLLQLTAVGLSAFVQPDWPFVFGSLDRRDPMLGMWLSLSTPATVILDWIEGSLLNPGELTVDDVIGRQS